MLKIGIDGRIVKVETSGDSTHEMAEFSWIPLIIGHTASKGSERSNAEPSLRLTNNAIFKQDLLQSGLNAGPSPHNLPKKLLILN